MTLAVIGVLPWHLKSLPVSPLLQLNIEKFPFTEYIPLYCKIALWYLHKQNVKKFDGRPYRKY